MAISASESTSQRRGETHDIVVVCYEYSSASWLEDRDSALRRPVPLGVLVALPPQRMWSTRGACRLRRGNRRGYTTVAAHIVRAPRKHDDHRRAERPRRAVWHHDGPASAQRLNQMRSQRTPTVECGVPSRLRDAPSRTGTAAWRGNPAARRFEIVDSVFALNLASALTSAARTAASSTHARAARYRMTDRGRWHVQAAQHHNHSRRSPPNDTRFGPVRQYGSYVIGKPLIYLWHAPDIPTPATAIPAR